MNEAAEASVQYLTVAFFEYLHWLRLKDFFSRFELIADTVLFEYEQKLIAVLQHEVEDAYVLIEINT